MKGKLTSDINRYERGNRTVKYGRWVILFISLALISSSFYLLLRCQKISKMNTAEYLSENKKIELNILDKYIDARLEGKKIKTDLLSKYIDARIDLLRLEFGLAMKSYTGAIMGGLILGLFFATWIWPSRNKLIVKGLRMLIALSEGNNNEKASNKSVR
jgi:hypothetical protein